MSVTRTPKQLPSLRIQTWRKARQKRTWMFEKQVSQILENVLGAYFEGIDTESLNVSLLAGKVVLEDLCVRPAAMASLGLPFTVKHGRVRRVELELSLRNLRGAPACMRIDGVEVVLDVDEDADPVGHDRPSSFTVPGAEAGVARQQRMQTDLERRRLALLSPGRGAGVQTASMVARMVAGFINNLIVEVTNVDIRVDAMANAHGRFVMGVSWQSASLTTTNADWRACVAAADAEFLFKQAQISALSVFTSCSPPNSPATSEVACSHVVAPVDVLARASLAVAAPSSFDRPLVSLDVKIGTAKLSMTTQNLSGLAQLLERLALNRRRRESASARPLALARHYRGHYAAWWRYAIDVARRQALARKQAWRRDVVFANAKRMLQYAPLFRRALNLLPLPPLEKHEEMAMQRLEEEMPDTMISAIRSGVQNRLQNDAREALAHARQALPKPSLFSRIFGARDTKEEGSKGGSGCRGLLVLGSYRVDITEDERRQLQEVIESSAGAWQEAPAPDEPAGWVKYALCLSLDADVQVSRSTPFAVAHGGRYLRRQWLRLPLLAESAAGARSRRAQECP